MIKTALLYSPVGGNVNNVTIKLGELIGDDKADIIHIKEVDAGVLDNYKQLILIGSTVGADHWDNEIIVDEWQEFFTKMVGNSFAGKKVAIVGLGNSVLYPEHFADGMANLYKKCTEKEATVYGSVESEGYTFTDSEALNDEGVFCGLPIDEDNEDDLTTERLENWISILQADFEF